MELKKGETIMIDATLHLPISFLHKAFSDRSGVPLDFFELYYRGKRLEGEAALASWGVGKGATIEVKMRGRGGMQTTHEEPSSSEAHATDQRAGNGSPIKEQETAAEAQGGQGGDEESWYVLPTAAADSGAGLQATFASQIDTHALQPVRYLPHPPLQ